MKVRTDFVTNSSSSSFVFKEFDKQYIRRLLKKHLYVPLQDEDEADIYELAKLDMNYIEGERFGEHRICDLMEVYSWFRNKILGEIIGIPFTEERPEHEKWKEKVRNIAKDSRCTNDMERKLAAILILDIYCDIYWGDEVKGKEIVICSEVFSTHLEEVGKSKIWNEYDIFPQYYQEHMASLQSYFEEYENKQISQLLEYLFDAQYLYFCEREVNYLLCDILKEEGICKYAAVHMG